MILTFFFIVIVIIIINIIIIIIIIIIFIIFVNNISAFNSLLLNFSVDKSYVFESKSTDF